MIEVAKSAGPERWPWKGTGAAIPPKPRMSMRAKASIQTVVMATVGFVLHRFVGHAVMAYIVWFLAVLVLAGGFVYPPLFHAFERFGQKLARWVAAGLTWGLLVPFYYICFGLGRIVVAVTGKDPMDRKYPEPDKATFWVPRPPVRNMEQYRKQH